jgi:cobalamin biosynthetic protein CobC
MIPFGAGVEPPRHGGDIGAARRLFPGAPEPFLDLSTGINPIPYPLPDLPAESFARLPEGEALAALKAAAAKAYGAPSTTHVVAAPGTQILLPLVAGLARPGRAAIVAPTYSEHSRAASLAGHAVTEVRDLGAVADAGLVVVTNPNNPDGRVFAKPDLLAIAKQLHARGGMLVVDEAFMDVGPAEASLAGDVSCGNVVVLRSFGKFFGLAGLRLGFAIAAPPLGARLEAQLGPWAVSGPAIAIGSQALIDAGWIEMTKRRLAQASARLDALLRESGVEILGGTALFRLVCTPAAAELFRHLGRAGILARAFAEQPTWLRFGLPAAEADWQRLEGALSGWRDRGPSPQIRRVELSAPVGAQGIQFDHAFRTRLRDLLMWRRDVRRFRRDALPTGTLEALIEQAGLAPSVGLSQPWRFVIVEDGAVRSAIRKNFEACNAEALAAQSPQRASLYARLKLAGLEEAPSHFAVFADRSTAQGHGLGRHTMPEMIDYSTVTAVHTIWLAARAQGVGMGWVSILDPVAVAGILNVPAEWKFIGYFCLGYPQADDTIPELEQAGWEQRRLPSSIIIRR